MFKKVYQRNLSDCGVACLLTIIKYYKGNNTYENIRYLTRCDSNGITALNLVEASKKLGFNAKGYKCEYEDLSNLVKPLICHFVLENGYNHYIVLYKCTSKYALIFDPYYGIKKYSKEYFQKLWDNICIELVPNRKLDVIEESNGKIFFDMLLKNKFIFILTIFISFLSIILTLVSNIYLKLLVDGYNTIYMLIIFILIVIIREANNYIRNRFMINLETNINNELVTSAHSNLLSLPNHYFSSRTSGDIITKFNDLEYIKNLIVSFPIFMTVDLSLILMTCIILININKYLSIIFFSLCLIYLVILLIFDKKLRNMVTINQESNSIKNSVLLENINSIESIKNMDIRDYRNNIFFSVFSSYLNNKKKYEKLYSFINLIKNLILYIGINIILFLGMRLVNNKIILLSDLIFFESLMIYFIEPLKDICELSPIYKNGKSAIKRVEEIYSIGNSSNEYTKLNDYDIEFCNVSFSYDGYKKIFNNFNYTIGENSKVFVMGSSGCGKSTLFKLLSKLYNIDSGTIKIGNIDINDINVSDYVTYISQDEKIFNDSLYNNIVLDSDNTNLDNILKITKLDKVILSKKIDLNDMIDEEGTTLSKGEKQKIILSRGLLKDKKIIILDESLSGVDEEDEYSIINNILNVYSDKTIIYISHSKVCTNLFTKILNLDN